MKILITGATSQQASVQAHKRSATYMGTLWETARAETTGRGTNEVFWLEPTVTWSKEDLLAWDHVVVGLAPLMAMGANRIYGALSVISHLWSSNKLTIVLDGPDPDLFTRNLKSVYSNWDTFTKPFFSYRKEYDLARSQEVNDRLHWAVGALLATQWPRTVVPGLPWTDTRRICSRLPDGAFGSLRKASFDQVLLDKYGQSEPQTLRLREWAIERGSDQKWKPSLNIGLPARELPVNHRLAVEPTVVETLRESVGFLSGPIKGDTWWTPRIATSLAVGTPVFTDWSRSQVLGPAWRALPGKHELASAKEVASLAREQLETFQAVTHNPQEELKFLFRSTVSAQNKKKRMAS